MNISIDFYDVFPPNSSTVLFDEKQMAHLVLDAVTARALHRKLEAIEIPGRERCGWTALGVVFCIALENARKNLTLANVHAKP